MAVRTNDPTITSTPDTPACDPATRITKSLLGYGVIAGPVYVLVSLAQALTRDGFDVPSFSSSTRGTRPAPATTGCDRNCARRHCAWVES